MGHMTPEERLLNLIKSNVAFKTGSSKTQEDQVFTEQNAPNPPLIESASVRVLSIKYNRVAIGALLTGVVFLLITAVSVVHHALKTGVNVPFENVKETAVFTTKITDISENGTSEKKLKIISPPTQLKLLGIILGEKPQAIIEDIFSNQTVTLNIGESILDYTFVNAQNGQIELSNATEIFRLKL